MEKSRQMEKAMVILKEIQTAIQKLMAIMTD